MYSVYARYGRRREEDYAEAVGAYRGGAKRVKNRIIDHKDCPSCDGSGKLEVWLAPPPCTPDCVKKLREYPQGSEGMMWLCDKPSHPIPTLWRPAERTRCLEAFGSTQGRRKKAA